MRTCPRHLAIDQERGLNPAAAQDYMPAVLLGQHPRPVFVREQEMVPTGRNRRGAGVEGSGMGAPLRSSKVRPSAPLFTPGDPCPTVGLFSCWIPRNDPKQEVMFGSFMTMMLGGGYVTTCGTRIDSGGDRTPRPSEWTRVRLSESG